MDVNNVQHSQKKNTTTLKQKNVHTVDTTNLNQNSKFLEHKWIIHPFTIGRSILLMFTYFCFMLIPFQLKYLKLTYLLFLVRVWPHLLMRGQKNCHLNAISYMFTQFVTLLSELYWHVHAIGYIFTQLATVTLQLATCFFGNTLICLCKLLHVSGTHLKKNSSFELNPRSSIII